jgi:hypothetical protein
VAGRVFLFVLSVSSSALNRVGFQFVLPTSSFLVRSSKPVPTRLFSCCCSLVCSVAATRFHLTAPLFDLPPTEFLSATGSFVAMTTLSPSAAEHASCASVPLPAGSLVPVAKNSSFCQRPRSEIWAPVFLSASRAHSSSHLASRSSCLVLFFHFSVLDVLHLGAGLTAPFGLNIVCS